MIRSLKRAHAIFMKFSKCSGNGLRIGFLLPFACVLVFAQSTGTLDSITADSLRAHLTYLTSDELAGRATPSHGLDLAADYIAGQFRRENLKPAAADGTYFQTAKLLQHHTARNVAGILEGSDPALRGQYILITAHYDHLGIVPNITPRSEGTYYGANDNASGTAALIEIAGALARMNPHPRRSIVFMAFYGEEEGLMGSRYYVAHPLVPLKNTVAEINLEQLGRTDDPAGSAAGLLTFTGIDYSNLADVFAGPLKAEGVNINRRADADAYFFRSDNWSFAEHDVVDTTIAVTLEFPDYHAFGDRISRIDFPNLTKTTRAIAAGLIKVADEAEAPHWTKPRPVAEASAPTFKKAR